MTGQLRMGPMAKAVVVVRRLERSIISRITGHLLAPADAMGPKVTSRAFSRRRDEAPSLFPGTMVEMAIFFFLRVFSVFFWGGCGLISGNLKS